MKTETQAMRPAPHNIGGGAPSIIVVRSSVNGRWGYCPKGSPLNNESGYPTMRDALNAIARDKSIPKGTPVQVEQPGLDSLELECNAPRLDPFASWPFPRED